MNKSYIYWSVVAFTLLLVTLFVLCFLLGKDEASKGSDHEEIISSQEEWLEGSYSSNEIVIDSGTMEINNAERGVDNNDITVSAYCSHGCDMPEGSEYNSIDGDLGTRWEHITDLEEEEEWITYDFGEIKQFDVIMVYDGVWGAHFGFDFQSSVDGVNYSTFDSLISVLDSTWYTRTYGDGIEARYIRLLEDSHGIDGYEVTEIRFLPRVSHTTAPTQIDGQEGSADKTLIKWETFTPTQTTPANTSITYQFRTSANGTDWTSWSASQTYSGSPLDLTGLTPNRYLQIKATLATTDAGATPQIDDYTINFHNNQKPNKPTAQTVIIGN